MFLLNVSYIKAPSQVEPHIKAHGEWVAKYLAEGLFLFAGPKKSGFRRCHWSCQHRKRNLMRVLAEDSYVQADVAEYQILDFDCKVYRD
jgi:uncharacterized protein YciI